MASRFASLAVALSLGCTSYTDHVRRVRVTLYQPEQRACAASCADGDDADAYGCLRRCPRASVAEGACDPHESAAEVACVEEEYRKAHHGAAIGVTIAVVVVLGVLLGAAVANADWCPDPDGDGEDSC